MQITFDGKTTTVPTVFAGCAVVQPEPTLNEMHASPDTPELFQSSAAQCLPTTTPTVNLCHQRQVHPSGPTLQVQELSVYAVLPVRTSSQAADYDLLRFVQCDVSIRTSGR